jgi:uncharacterized membrane protein
MVPTAWSTTAPGMVWQRAVPSWMQRFWHWVVRDLDAAADVVAHRHPAAAAPADGQALQQRGALAGGAGAAIGAVRGRIAQQQPLVGLLLSS